MILFGSRAKGTARPDSDWDVLLDKPASMPHFQYTEDAANWLDSFFQDVQAQIRETFRIPDADIIDIFVGMSPTYAIRLFAIDDMWQTHGVVVMVAGIPLPKPESN